MKERLWLAQAQVWRLLILLILFPCSVWAAGLEIYFVRHAETIENATGVKSEANNATFSPLGEEQVRQLTEKLKPMRFDAILVSPTERTLYTILPYLQATGQVATIWPELTECCWQHDGRGDGGSLVTGPAIRIPPEGKALFVFRDNRSDSKYMSDTYGDGIAQVQETIRLLQKQYFNSGKTILIVGHYHAGSRLIEMLLGRDPVGRFKIRNGQMSHLVQGADGSFSLVELNGYANPYVGD